MKTLKFKTNINCGNCVAKVKSFLDAETGISSWEVDTSNPDKTLTVKGEEITSSKITQLVNKAGYSIEAVREKNFLHSVTEMLKKNCCK